MVSKVNPKRLIKKSFLLGRWTVSILAQCVMGADRSSGVIPANISLVIPHQSGARSHTVNTSKSPSSSSPGEHLTASIISLLGL